MQTQYIVQVVEVLCIHTHIWHQSFIHMRNYIKYRMRCSLHMYSMDHFLVFSVTMKSASADGDSMDLFLVFSVIMTTSMLGLLLVNSRLGQNCLIVEDQIMRKETVFLQQCWG